MVQVASEVRKRNKPMDEEDDRKNTVQYAIEDCIDRAARNEGSWDDFLGIVRDTQDFMKDEREVYNRLLSWGVCFNFMAKSLDVDRVGAVGGLIKDYIHHIRDEVLNRHIVMYAYHHSDYSNDFLNCEVEWIETRVKEIYDALPALFANDDNPIIYKTFKATGDEVETVFESLIDDNREPSSSDFYGVAFMKVIGWAANGGDYVSSLARMVECSFIKLANADKTLSRIHENVRIFTAKLVHGAIEALISLNYKTPIEKLAETLLWEDGLSIHNKICNLLTYYSVNKSEIRERDERIIYNRLMLMLSNLVDVFINVIGLLMKVKKKS